MNLYKYAKDFLESKGYKYTGIYSNSGYEITETTSRCCLREGGNAEIVLWSNKFDESKLEIQILLWTKSFYDMKSQLFSVANEQELEVALNLLLSMLPVVNEAMFRCDEDIEHLEDTIEDYKKALIHEARTEREIKENKHSNF